VDGADVPNNIPQHMIDRVKERKARAALGLGIGSQCPTQENEEL
jgi:hypothetical protein